jgi:hypothetical protein
MTVQTINIGNVVNDGLGDDLRTAFQKVNANFATLDAELGLNGLNLDNTGEGVFKQKTGSIFEFKSIKAVGSGIQVSSNDSNILIENTATDRFNRIDTDSGSILASVNRQITFEGIPSPGTDYHPASVTGRQDIEVTASGSTIKFKTVIPITDILTVYDFGYINGTFANIAQFSLSWTNVDFGTFEFPASVNLDLGNFS